jgi:Gram-negative bacterial TonB protein C-terminal
MRKLTIQLTFLILTFFVGVAAYYFYYLPVSRSEKTNLYGEFSSVPAMQVPQKQEDELSISEFYSVSPCEETNPFEYSRKWDAQGTISVGVVNSRVSCGVLPELSSRADANVSGIVTADVLIDVTGKVLEVGVKNQTPLMQKAIIRAARQTRFEPYMLRGDAHDARGIIMYKFDGKGSVQLYKFKRSAS